MKVRNEIKPKILITLVLLQLIITILYIVPNVYIDFYIFAIIASTILGLSVYFNEVEIFFSIFLFKQNISEQQKIKYKIYLSIYAAFSSLLGMFTLKFFMIFIETAKGFGEFLFNSPDARDNLYVILNIAELLVTRKNIIFLLAFLFVLFCFIILELCPYLKRIRELYSRKKQIEIYKFEKSNFLDICFASGFSIILFFQAFFLIIAAVKRYNIKNFSDWILHLNKPTIEKTENIDSSILNIYKFFLYFSMIWTPFFNYTNYLHYIYLAIVSFPIILSISLYILFNKTIYEDKKYIRIINIVFICALLLIALIHFMEPSINPILNLMMNFLNNIAGAPAIVVSVFILIVSVILAVGLIIISFDRIVKFRLGRNDKAVSAAQKLYDYELKLFIFKALMRVSVLSVFIYYTFKPGVIIAYELLYILVFIVLIGMGVPFTNDKIYKDISRLFNKEEIQKSFKKNHAKIEQFIKLEFYFNIIFTIQSSFFILILVNFCRNCDKVTANTVIGLTILFGLPFLLFIAVLLTIGKIHDIEKFCFIKINLLERVQNGIFKARNK